MSTAQNDALETRAREITEIFAGVDEGVQQIIAPMITETAYLETELSTLRALPKIRIHPSDPQRQQATPAAKLYKELLQQYTNCIKVLTGVLHREAPEEESPLRQWLEERAKQNGA